MEAPTNAREAISAALGTERRTQHFYSDVAENSPDDAVRAFAAEGVPAPGAYETFAGGLINGWARVLSSVPPAACISR